MANLGRDSQGSSSPLSATAAPRPPLRMFWPLFASRPAEPGSGEKLAPLAALQPAARAPALFPRPTHHERRARKYARRMLGACR